MDRVFTCADQPFDAKHWIAVAIGEPDTDQRHIGILHRTKDSVPEFLHLAWHCLLQNDSELPDYLTVWVAPTVPRERQRSIAAFCRRVWRKNAKDGIPYAFSKPCKSFDASTAAFLIGPSRYGLTCATFVLAVFDAAGIPLADYLTWTLDRPGDRQWQKKIIRTLEHQQVEQEHIDHLRKEAGAVRYRPEEVAASTALAPPPAAFPDAEKLGEQILNRISEQGGTKRQTH